MLLWLLINLWVRIENIATTNWFCYCLIDTCSSKRLVNFQNKSLTRLRN